MFKFWEINKKKIEIIFDITTHFLKNKFNFFKSKMNTLKQMQFFKIVKKNFTTIQKKLCQLYLVLQ